MLITHVPESVTDFLCSYLVDLKTKVQSPDYNNALTEGVWWSGDALDFYNNDIELSKRCDFLKSIAEKTFHTRLNFYYLHFIDYQRGGSMMFHNHAYKEDYVFILYLNDCLDGETNFDLSNLVSLVPKKSQIVFFESIIDHSGSYSTNKQILVGGMKKV